MVSGDHHRANTGALAAFHRLDGLFTGRVQQPYQPQQAQPRLHMRVIELSVFLHCLLGNRQHPQAFRGQRFDMRLPLAGHQRGFAFIGDHMAAHFDNAIRRTLDQQLPPTLKVMQRGHVLVL